MHRPVVLDPPVPLREWRPDLPEGDLRSIWLHWTAYRYDDVFPAYHFCISRPGDVLVHHTHDLRENMRDVRLDPSLPYAAHTAGRNSWAIGLSVAAMQDASPHDFGPCPITEPQLKFAVMDAAGKPVFCDSDFYPVAREGGELPIPIAVIKSANLEYDVRVDLQRAKQREKNR